VLQDNENEIERFYSAQRISPFLGSDDFIRKIKKDRSATMLSEEIPEHLALVRKYLPTVEEVVNATATCFAVLPSSIISYSDRTHNNLPRKVAIYLSYYLTGKKQKDIANVFNGITYSAISQTCRRFEQTLKENGEILNKVNLIKMNLSNVKI